MSTRSCIAIMTEDGGKPTYKGAYCHYDGYPDDEEGGGAKGVGWQLKNCYKDAAKIEALLENGAMRSLGSTIEDTDYFDDGEEGDMPVLSDSYNALLNHFDWSYAYLFVVSEGQWYVTDGEGKQTLL